MLTQKYGQPRCDVAWDQSVGVGTSQSTYLPRRSQNYLINKVFLRMVDSIM
jgi:hypothetical protein